MGIFRQFHIQNRLWSILAFVVGALLLIAWLTLGQLKSNMYAAKDEKNRHLVETVHSVFTHFHERQLSGELTEEQAQSMAKAVVSALRYDEVNYFWVNDFDANMVMHPIKSELDGTDVSGFKDPTGNAIYAGFARIGREQGQGRYEYMFPKPGSGDEPIQKFSHVKAFKAWGWVVGTGAYVDDVEQQYVDALLSNLLVILVLLVAIGGIILLILRSIIMPLQEAKEAMQDIATGSGDLSAQLSVEGNDELTELSQNFNTFVGKIRDTVLNVEQSVNSLANAASDLAGTNQQSSAGIEQQSDQLAQVASAVSELTYSLKEVAQGAEHVASIVQQVDQEAGQGVGQLNGAVSSLQNLSSEIDKAVAVIGELASQTDSIGSVLDVIRSIAEQTNLLALNAAIEAARAGEQGRGFAVVADEVRTLASRTQQSTEEIDQMIVQLQNNAKQAVEVISASQTRANETVEGASDAREALETISSSVGQLSDIGNQNATAVTQQSATVTEINQRIDSIHDIAQKTSSLAADATACGQQVEVISSELGDRMSSFSC